MSERMTTIVSALVALGILGLGVTAQPTGDGDDVRVESLESDVRFQIEMSWRHDGRIRTARQAELEQTLAAFEKSPQSPADVQLLEQWLRAAVVASLPGESGKFPATPAFGKPAVAVQPPATASPALVPPTPAPAITPAKQAAQPPRDVELKPNQAYTPPRAREIRLVPRSQQAKTPAPAESAPQRIVAAKPVAPAPTPPPIQTPRQAAAPARTPEASPAPPASAIAATQQPRMIERDAEPAEQKQPETKPVASALPALVENATPPGPTMVSPPSELPAPATIVAEETPATPAIAAKPVAPALPGDDPVTVNLAELNAQIRGYHEGLDEIDAEIVARRGELSEGEIARLVVQLEQLVGHHSFVRLYYDGLSKSERRFVSAPRSLKETVDLVRSELAALNAAEEDFLTSLEGAAEEDELNRRLDELSGVAELGDRD
jgi:hypothetical protein